MTKFMPWYRDYVIKVTHNNTVCHTIDFLSSLRTRSTWHDIHPESFVHNVILLRFTGFNKIRFTYPRSLNNRASRINKASVEALALDRAPLISRPASHRIFYTNFDLRFYLDIFFLLVVIVAVREKHQDLWSLLCHSPS